MANSAYRFSLASDSVAGMAKILETLESKEHALKAGELAKLLGVTRQHIYKMAAASAIPSFRIGAAVRFDPKQVRESLSPNVVRMEFRLADLENPARQHGVRLGQVATRQNSVDELKRASIVMRAESYRRRLFSEFDLAKEVFLP